MDSTSPRSGERASYYSAVCLETGEVEWMELEGNSNSGTSAAFLDQLRKGHAGPLNVIWDNAPAHRGEAVGEYLRTPGLGLGERGGHWKSVSGDQGLGAAEGRQLPGRTGQPGKRGEAPLPDGPTVKGRSTPAKFPARFPASGECTSHLGFGLVLQRRFLNLVSFWPEIASRKARPPPSCQARGQVSIKRCSRSLL